MKSILSRLGTVALTIATLAGVLAVAGGSADASGDQEDRTYRITVNNITDGQYFTPVNVAGHDGNRLFQNNREASSGIQAVAENGDVDALVQEWTAAGLDNVVVGDAPIQHGQSATAVFSTKESRYSLVSMIICTNDGFGGVNSRRLPNRIGQTTTDQILSYDAGTEINTELNADIVPAPFCEGNGIGTGESDPALAENGRIRGHRGIRGVGDLGDNFDFSRRVGTVTIERIG